MSRSLYNQPDIKKLRSTIEGQNFEKKPASIPSRELAKWLSSFANSSVEGGLVVIGIENDNQMIGINRIGISKINKLRQASVVFCPTAKVECKTFSIINSKKENDKLLFFYVEYSSNRVITLTSGEAYERIGDQTRKMSPERLKEMQYNKGETPFEKELIPNLTIEQLNKSLMNNFIKKWIERDKIKSKQTIESLILNKNFGEKVRNKVLINYAGLLMFFDQPDKFIPGAEIRFSKYEGTNIKTGIHSNIIKEQDFNGPITNQIEGVVQMIRTQIREFKFLGSDGKFKVVFEYPEFAWYESIVNAVVHRSYSIKNSKIFVGMFDDRIEVQSPGNLPSIVTLQNIYKVNFPRNPILMKALLCLGYVRSAGEGIDRIKDEMIEANLLKPDFRDDKDAVSFTIVLKNNVKRRELYQRSKLAEKLTPGYLETIDEEEKKIIYYILINQEAGTKDLAKEINKSKSTAIRKIRRLEELELIEKTVNIGPKIKYKLTRKIIGLNKKESTKISPQQSKLL